MRRCRHNRRGFTLIELLVVVAIIALLISILLPSLNAARGQGRQTVCLANMKSLGEAAHFYARDNRDVVIRAEGVRTHFVPMLLRYVGHPEWVDRMWDQSTGRIDLTRLLEACAASRILNCPSFPADEQPLDVVVNSFQIPFPVSPTDRISDVPGDGPVPINDSRQSQFTNISRLGAAQPANIIYIVEAHQNMPLPDSPSHDWGRWTDVFNPEQMALARFPRVANEQRHPGGVTATYFDAHAAVQAIRRVDPGAGYTLRDRIRRFTYDAAEPD